MVLGNLQFLLFLILPQFVLKPESFKLILKFQLVLPPHECLSLLLCIFDLLFDPEIDLLLNFIEQVLLLPQEVPFDSLDLPLLIDLANNVVVDVLQVGLADFGELDGQSLEILNQVLAPAEVGLVDVQELLVVQIAGDDWVTETKHFLVVQNNLLLLQFNRL